jgi:undecaprenyl-diphosphatase
MEEELLEADAAIAVWLNHFAIESAYLKALVQYLASDYLVPVLLSLTVLGMWLAPSLPAARLRYQRAAIVALAGMGFAALAVAIINDVVFRPRPFTKHPVFLLFYAPTDSSFPLHAAAVGFGFATGIWMADRRLGVWALSLAALWGLSRVMAGVAYLTDVLAAALVGVAVTLAFSLALKPFDGLLRLVLGMARGLHLA